MVPDRATAMPGKSVFYYSRFIDAVTLFVLANEEER
jgi:hypothetical protein